MTKRGATVQHLSALTVTVKLVVNCAPCFVRVSSVWFIIYAICLSFCSVPLLSTFLKTICGGMKRKRKLSSHLRNWNQKLFSDCIFFLKKRSRYQKSVIELQLIYILPTPLSCSRKSTLCSDLWLITKNKRHYQRIFCQWWCYCSSDCSSMFSPLLRIYILHLGSSLVHQRPPPDTESLCNCVFLPLISRGEL